MVQANYQYKGIAGVCVDIQSEERGPSVRAGPSGRPGISRQSMQSMSVADSLLAQKSPAPPAASADVSVVCVCVEGGWEGEGGVRGVGPVSKQITISMEGGDRYRDFGGGGGRGRQGRAA